MSYKCVAVSLGCYEHGYINIWSWYTITRVLDTSNSFHPYGVNKSSSNVPGRAGWRRGGHICRMADETVYDPIDKWRRVVVRWISLTTRPIRFLLPLSVLFSLHDLFTITPLWCERHHRTYLYARPTLHLHKRLLDSLHIAYYEIIYTSLFTSKMVVQLRSDC